MNKTAVEKSLCSKLIRKAHANPDTREELLPFIERLAKSKPSDRARAKSPQAAKSLHRRYMQKHPQSKKTWKDFMDPNAGSSKRAPGQEPEDKSQGKSDGGLLKKIKAMPGNIASGTWKRLKAAPAHVHKFVMDHSHRKAVLQKGVEGVKKAPHKTFKSVLNSFLKESGSVVGATKAIGKLVKGKKPTGAELHDLYGVGVYAAGTVVAAMTGGASIAATALGHSFAMHVGIKAVGEILDEGFLGYEAVQTVFDFATKLGADGKEPDKAKLAELLSAAIVMALEKGLSDEDMKKILAEDVKIPS